MLKRYKRKRLKSSTKLTEDGVKKERCNPIVWRITYANAVIAKSTAKIQAIRPRLTYANKNITCNHTGGI
jgi:hypothetical protein